MKHTIHPIKLDNGVEGIFIDIPSASVMSFEINFRAGEYLVERNKWEAPHIMEHLLLGANELIPKARDFQAEFEKNGAYCNASTGTYEVAYDAECADFEWKRIAELLEVAITKPLFLDEEFIAEVGNVREELVYRSNNHFRHLSLALREAYGMLAVTDLERLKLMDNVTRDDIWAHYQKTHTTSNLRFVIGGRLNQRRRESLTKLFENIELPIGDGRVELPHEVPKKLNKAVYINNPTVKNIYFYIDTFILRTMTNPEMDALNLLNIMLTETMYSRILGTARERGLVYGMNSGYNQSRDSANWWMAAQVSPQNAPALFEVIVHEMKCIFDAKFLAREIKAAKQYALGRFQRSGQTVGGTVAGYSGRYFFDGVIDDYYKIPKRIKAVTKQSIVDITNELFSQNIWGIGGLGSAGPDFVNDLRKQIKPLWN